MTKRSTSPSRFLHRLRVERSPNRVLSGTAAGIGDRFGVDADLVRAAFVVLAFCGGVGAVVYGVAWALSLPSAQAPSKEISREQAIALAAIYLGGLFLMRGLGLWFGDEVVWSVALLAFGVAAIAARQTGGSRDWVGRIATEEGRSASARIVAGAILLTAGTVLVLRSVTVFEALGAVAVGVGITAAGLLLVFGPWIWRLAGELATERRERIRSEERADMAAHLHDSVLQTLSLIQRAEDPRRMAMLARAQERELRTWLYRDERRSGSLEQALQEAADRVEAEHLVAVDLIVVGSADLDDRSRPLAAAIGEAMTNAAKHSGAASISVYVEAGEGLDAWITDQGSGFDPDSVPADRHGISESILGRMRRAGGGADVVSSESGTEVHLWIEGRQ